MDQPLKGQTHSMEEVWIKTEPTDSESTVYFHIKCEEELTIDETKTSIVPAFMEREPPEAVRIQPEIAYNDYNCISSNSIASQLSKSEKQNAIIEASDKKFNIQLHQKTSTDGKSFPCDKCKKTFFRRSSLLRHKLFHSGEKRFECDVCGMKFSQKCHIKPHQLTHTFGQQHLFSCDECGTKFARKSGLTQHKKLHTRETIFCCNICRIKFDKKEYLERHTREKHQQVH